MRGGLGLASGALATAAQSSGGSVGADKEGMQDWLVSTFQDSTTFLEDTLRIALGGEGDTSTLPYQSDFYQTHVANFLADGVWLVDDDNADFRTAIDQGAIWMVSLPNLKQRICRHRVVQ